MEAEIQIDLGRLTIADYPAVQRVAQAVLRDPADVETSQELIALLDRVVEGGASGRPIGEFHAIRIAFVRAVAEMIRPKSLRGSSGATSG